MANYHQTMLFVSIQRMDGDAVPATPQDSGDVWTYVKMVEAALEKRIQKLERFGFEFDDPVALASSVPGLSPSIRRYLTSNATLRSASTPVRPTNLTQSFLAELTSINQNSDTNRVTDHVTSSDITERTEQSERTEQAEPANSTETSEPTDPLLKRLRQCKQTVTADKLARPSIKLTDAQTAICATQWKLKCSMGNFAQRCLFALVNSEELAGKSCRGLKNKPAIPKKYLDMVLEALYMFYGNEFTSNLVENWKACTRAIDKFNRERRRTYKKNQ